MAALSLAVAAGWVPFAIVLVIVLCFAFFYIRYFQSKYDSQIQSTITSILGLALALVTIALVPIDIFLVSYMKDGQGHFKDWAKNQSDRDWVSSSVLHAYYALYACGLLFLFVILPFSYFFYEEGDEDTTVKSRLCTATKFTLCFVFVAVVLFVIGIFAPLKSLPQTNGTDWDIFKHVISDLKTSNLEDSLSFNISSVTVLGMILLIIYTGYGVSAWPMDLIKGRRSTVREQADLQEERSHLEAEINTIKAKYAVGRRSMSRRDRRRLEDLEERVELINRREGHLVAAGQSCIRKCGRLLRPFEVIFGVIFLLITLLIFLSLLLTNIDKLMHSLGWRMGYTLPVRRLPNPIDITLVFSQRVFPVDYVLFGAIVTFLFFCSMGGLQHIGIWFCCVRMYKMRPGRSKPQALLMLVFLLTLLLLAMNVLIYQLTPQYATYGNQHYIAEKLVNNSNVTELKPCNTDAPPGECVMTRMSVLLVRFFYKVWFFGAVYYWATWLLLLVILVGFVVAVIRKRRSAVEGCVDRDDFDTDDSILTA